MTRSPHVSGQLFLHPFPIAATTIFSRNPIYSINVIPHLHLRGAGRGGNRRPRVFSTVPESWGGEGGGGVILFRDIAQPFFAPATAPPPPPCLLPPPRHPKFMRSICGLRSLTILIRPARISPAILSPILNLRLTETG